MNHRGSFFARSAVAQQPEPVCEQRHHQQYAENLGVDGYLLKPVRLERLIKLAHDILQTAS